MTAIEMYTILFGVIVGGIVAITIFATWVVHKRLT